jgi:hypothetical protein
MIQRTMKGHLMFSRKLTMSIAVGAAAIAVPNEIIDRAMSTLACAQCGRSLPSDATELARWKYGNLAASG